MVNVKKAFRCLVPHYVIAESSIGCGCDLEEQCDCMPDMYLTVDSYTGYGTAFWTYTDETCPPETDDCGKAYYCKFANAQPFWAVGLNDAAEKYLTLLDLNSIAANVNGVNNKRAEGTLAVLNEEAAKFK